MNTLYAGYAITPFRLLRCVVDKSSPITAHHVYLFNYLWLQVKNWEKTPIVTKNMFMPAVIKALPYKKSMVYELFSDLESEFFIKRVKIKNKKRGNLFFVKFLSDPRQ